MEIIILPTPAEVGQLQAKYRAERDRLTANGAAKLFRRAGYSSGGMP